VSFGRTRPAADLPNNANPLWELSSFSEAAKAAALLVVKLPEPPFSQASQLPHWPGFHTVLLSPGENSSYSNQAVLKKKADFIAKRQ
jgi:hypothetical protein